MGMSILLLVALCVALQTASLRLEVRHEGEAVVDAAVTVNGTLHRTSERGVVELALPPGAIEIVVAKEGFAPASVSLGLVAGETRTVAVDLESQEAMEEQVTVAATRTDRRIEDQPMRVEVLDRDEIEEKVLMTPGDIVMMLNETGGLRVQSTSPSLGAASVRIQGMRGRYTRFLSDGLPLFGEQVGSFGLLDPANRSGPRRSDQGCGLVSIWGGGDGRSRQPGVTPARRDTRGRSADQPLDPRRDGWHLLVFEPAHTLVGHDADRRRPRSRALGR